MNLLKYSSILLIFALVSTPTFAQETKHYIEFGSYYSFFEIEDELAEIYNLIPRSRFKQNFSFSAGVSAEAFSDDDISFSLGVKYKNIRIIKEYLRNDVGKSYFSFHSITMPATISYNFFDFDFPRFFTGFELEILFDGYEQQDYYNIKYYENNNSEELLYYGKELDIINVRQWHISYFVGLSQSINIFNQELNLKLLHVLTRKIPWVEYSIYEQTNFEFIVGYRL